MKTITMILLGLSFSFTAWAAEDGAHNHAHEDHPEVRAKSADDGHDHDAHLDEHIDHKAGEGHGVHKGHAHDEAEDDHDDHKGHAHDEAEDDHDDHKGHAHDEAEDDHDDHKGHGDEHANEVHLRPKQMHMLDIRSEALVPRVIGQVIKAPGEVRINAYASETIAPRIAAQVVQRSARLGDHVEPGQPLVTLSSVEMAGAQGDLVVAHREWQRVRQLGRKIVSESRYLQAQIGYQQTRARVMSYGMSKPDVEQLLRDGAKRADGSFVLLAGRSGTVISDDFVVGEIVEAGRGLFQITNEEVRWVEARLAPGDATMVHIGNAVRVNYGQQQLSGKVIQLDHQLDETTRTRAVRIELPDPAHLVHPGQFVDVSVETGGGSPVMALSEDAVLRSPDGDWQVFVAGDEPGAFKPVEVRRISNIGELVVIEGLSPGTQVVTHGAFFLASELAKGGFDPHNH